MVNKESCIFHPQNLRFTQKSGTTRAKCWAFRLTKKYFGTRGQGSDLCPPLEADLLPQRGVRGLGHAPDCELVRRGDGQRLGGLAVAHARDLQRLLGRCEDRLEFRRGIQAPYISSSHS